MIRLLTRNRKHRPPVAAGWPHIPI